MATKDLPSSKNIAIAEKAVEDAVAIKGGNDDKDKYKSDTDQKITLGHYLVSIPI